MNAFVQTMASSLDMSSLDDVVEGERALAAAETRAARVRAGVRLGWVLRRQDPARALSLLQTLEPDLVYIPDDDGERSRLCGHLALARAESCLALGQSDVVSGYLTAASVAFTNGNAQQGRRLATARSDRGDALREALGTLELLSQIGLEITASLDLEAVFEALHRHLGRLLSAPSMFIALLDRSGQTLDLGFWIEDGVRLSPVQIALDDEASIAAACVREDREILLDVASATMKTALNPGTREMKTTLFRPLKVGDRILGVLSIQSDLQDAYGPREQDIFRALCAYGAIALANAATFTELDEALLALRETQSRMVQQEKLASLGELVAGLAHEVSTPVGIVATTASHFAENFRMVRERLESGILRKSELLQLIEQAADSLRLIEGNARRASDLVNSFKQVSADRAKEDQREVLLLDYLRDIVTMVEPLLKPRGVIAGVDGENVRCVLSPGLLAQVVTNLLQNTVMHAFDGIAKPMVTIMARAAGPHSVHIDVVDNGVGMAPEVRSKAFEPFFTTRRGRGGTGLGLHIVHNIVTGVLKGVIDIDSAPGQGTRFSINLPVGMISAPSLVARRFASIGDALE